MNDVYITAGIVGVVQFLKEIFPKYVNGSVTILVSVILGGLIGITGFNGLNVLTGLSLGLAATGTHQLLTATSGK